MTSPRSLLKAWRVYPRKQLGQNFLEDPAVSDMIVRRSGFSAEDTVLEIGAGLGALTIPLANRVKKVYAVEKDRRLIGLLRSELLANRLSNVELVEEDILRVNTHALAEACHRRITVIGNLPYSISSQILVKLIAERASIDRAVLMFQRELAQRLAAEAGSKDYGRLTVMLRYCAQMRSLADVSAKVFFPRPRIDSRVLEITFCGVRGCPATNEDLLLGVIKAAFSKRRKTLKNALTNSPLPFPPDTILEALTASDIDPVRRAETLSVEEFVALSNRLSEAGIHRLTIPSP